MLKKLIINIISLIKSIRFNFRYFPFYDACRLPILLAPNVKIKNMWRGGILLNEVRFGIAHIGFHEADGLDTYALHTIIDIKKGGKISCNGDIHIGHGAVLCVNKNGRLTLGKNFAISGDTKIICSDCIETGDNVQFSWNTIVMDSDAHTIINLNNQALINHKQIQIGNNVWIAANNVLLKGTKIGNNCVVGINSLINKEFKENNTIIAGNPAKVIKSISGWSL